MSPSSKFPLTAWTVVLDAKEGKKESIERLCRDYWKPLYAYLRYTGQGKEDAMDITQEFVVKILEGKFLSSLKNREGKFRSFLLKSLKHFVISRNRFDKAEKRGGSIQFLSIDSFDSYDSSLFAMNSSLCPDLQYEKAWARTVISNVLEVLREEFKEKGKLDLYEEILPFLFKENSKLEVVASKLGKSKGAVSMQVMRLKQYAGEVMRREIAQTLDGDVDIDEEIAYLMKIVAQ